MNPTNTGFIHYNVQYVMFIVTYIPWVGNLTLGNNTYYTKLTCFVICAMI